MRHGTRGAALVMVLVMAAAGMALAAAIARTAVLELAMAERDAARLRATAAAEAGLAEALRRREWSAADPWRAAGITTNGARWEVEVRLDAARLDQALELVEWHFEIESAGRAGPAAMTILQGFKVLGALPGEPRRTWWRQAEPAS